MNKYMKIGLAALVLVAGNVRLNAQGVVPEVRMVRPTTELKKIGSIEFGDFGQPIYTIGGVLALYDLNKIEQYTNILDSTRKKLLELKKQNPQAKRALVGENVAVVGSADGLKVFYDTSSGKPVFDLNKTNF